MTVVRYHVPDYGRLAYTTSLGIKTHLHTPSSKPSNFRRTFVTPLFDLEHTSYLSAKMSSIYSRSTNASSSRSGTTSDSNYIDTYGAYDVFFALAARTAINARIEAHPNRQVSPTERDLLDRAHSLWYSPGMESQREMAATEVLDFLVRGEEADRERRRNGGVTPRPVDQQVREANERVSALQEQLRAAVAGGGAAERRADVGRGGGGGPTNAEAQLAGRDHLAEKLRDLI